MERTSMDAGTRESGRCQITDGGRVMIQRIFVKVKSVDGGCFMKLQVRWGRRATLERFAAALRDPVWGVWFGWPRHPARSTGLGSPVVRVTVLRQPGSGIPLSGLRSYGVRDFPPESGE